MAPIPPGSIVPRPPSMYNTLGQVPIDQHRLFTLLAPDQITKFKELLSKHPTKSLDILFKASAKGKTELLCVLLEMGIRLVAAADKHQSLVPLHVASFQGHLECAKLLVEKGGVNVHARDDLGGTSLMRAAWGGRVEVVEWLLSEEADVAVRQEGV